MSARRFPITALAVAMVLSGAARASADPVVLVTTFGPSPGYSSELAYGSSDQTHLYIGFQLAVPAQVTSITVPVLFANSVSNRLVASILASESGRPSFSFGSRLDQIELAPPSDAAPNTVSVLTFTSSAQPILQADTLYFLSVGACCGFDVLFWPRGNAGIDGIVARAFGADARTSVGPLAAFRIEGEPISAPVPEPGTLLLAASGLGLLSRRLRRRLDRQS